MEVLPQLNHLRVRAGSRPYVRILEPRKLCSTFDLEAHHLDALGLDEAERAVVLERAHERAWPPAIRTLNDRLEARETLLTYRVVWVGSFEAQCLVQVLANDNQELPEGFVPTEDFYIVFQAEGVEEPESLVP